MDHGLLTHIQISPEGLADPGGGGVYPTASTAGPQGQLGRPMSAANVAPRPGTEFRAAIWHPAAASPKKRAPSGCGPDAPFLALRVTTPADLLLRRTSLPMTLGLSRPRHVTGEPAVTLLRVASRQPVYAEETPAWKGKGRPPGLFHQNETTAAPG